MEGCKCNYEDLSHPVHNVENCIDLFELIFDSSFVIQVFSEFNLVLLEKPPLPLRKDPTKRYVLAHEKEGDRLHYFGEQGLVLD